MRLVWHYRELEANTDDERWDRLQFENLHNELFFKLHAYEKRNRQHQPQKEFLAECVREAEINFYVFNSELQGMGHHCE